MYWCVYDMMQHQHGCKEQQAFWHMQVCQVWYSSTSDVMQRLKMLISIVWCLGGKQAVTQPQCHVSGEEPEQLMLLMALSGLKAVQICRRC
jgi:hypothetical protein